MARRRGRGVTEELGGASEGLGDGCGRGGAHRWRRLRSVLARERARGEDEDGRRVREFHGGWRGTHGGVQGVGDAGSQAGGGSGACARATSTHSAYWPRGEDDMAGGGGLGRHSAKPDGLHSR